MALTVTRDMRSILASEVLTSTSLDFGFPLLPGESRAMAFRVVNDTENAKEITISAAGENPERVSFSHREKSDYAPTLTVNVRGGGMSDTVYVRVTCPNSAEPAVIDSLVMLDSEAITLTYICVSSLLEITNPTDYWNERTTDVSNHFQEDGIVLDLEVWTPLIDKTTLTATPAKTLDDIQKRRLERWVNPWDGEFWSYETIQQYKAFIGNYAIQTPYPLEWSNVNLGWAETMRLMIEPSCDLFLSREYTKWGVVGAETELFQRTVYTINRRGKRFSLENIRPHFSPTGHFLFWLCELFEVFVPNTHNVMGWLPWNALYPWKQDNICHYVQTFNYTDDPYSDPYEEPYT